MVDSQSDRGTIRGNMKTAIVGGGLSGLTIGYLLNKQGLQFEVLEQAPSCGGLLRTLNEKGFTFDLGGSHIIFSKNESVLKFMLELLKGNKVKNKRNTKVLYKGCYVKYPFENGLSDLPLEENFECLNSFIHGLLSRAKEGDCKAVNLEEWFYRTFGDGITEKYLIPYNEKIWKFSVKEMGLDWVERIPDPPVEDIIRSSLGISTEGYTHQINFFYPKIGGIETVVNCLSREMLDRITNNFLVTEVSREGNQWLVSNGQAFKKFDHIISTIPVQELILAVDAPKEVRLAAKNLKYNSLITVMIGLNQKRLNDLSWLYIPDKHVLTHRVSFPSNYSPCVAPSNESSVLAEITCIPGDEVWNWKDEDLIDKVITDLSSLGIMDKQAVNFANVSRSKYAYVINDLDYRKNLSTIKKYFETLGIDLVGRFSEYEYMNMDACIASAMKLIKRLTS